MPVYLVVATPLLGGSAFDEALRVRIELGDASFFVVVPTIVPEDSGPVWCVEGLVGYGCGPGSEPSGRLERAQVATEERLQEVVERVRELGGDVWGEIGCADQVGAVGMVLESHDVAEIILARPVARIARVMKSDLTSRLRRRTRIPVLEIAANRDVERRRSGPETERASDGADHLGDRP